MLLLMIACGAEPAPPPVVVVEPEPERVLYVQASTLNLRDPDGKRIGRLAINSPLTISEELGESAVVTAGNGSKGLVPLEYLGAEPLTAGKAVSNAASASGEERINWLQRAAAIDPSREVLAALEKAYLERGDSKRASVIRGQLGWPAHIRPVTGWQQPGEPLQIEYATPWDESGTAREEVRKSIRLQVGAQVWVLPDLAGPVKGTVRSIEHENLNECSGEDGWVVAIDATLPPGTRAIAVSTTTAPAAWAAPPRAPALNREVAGRQAAAWVNETFGDRDLDELTVYPHGDAWRVDVAEEVPEPAGADSMFGWHRHVVLEIDGEGVRVLSREAHEVEVGEDRVVAERDLDGDGHAEFIHDDGCSAAFTGQDGRMLTSSIFRCCGC